MRPHKICCVYLLPIDVLCALKTCFNFILDVSHFRPRKSWYCFQALITYVNAPKDHQSEILTEFINDVLRSRVEEGRQGVASSPDLFGLGASGGSRTATVLDIPLDSGQSDPQN